MEKVKTIACNVALIVLVTLILIWGETLYRQHVQFDKGEKAAAAGDFIGAVAGYESAIHMYTPGSSLVESAAQKLWQLANLSEQRGDLQRALVAYRSLRSSFYAIAGITAPGSDWIERCDARIGYLVRLQTGR